MKRETGGHTMERREMMRLEAGAESVPRYPGISENEDSLFTDEENGFFGVFDGLGGAVGGEIASGIARDWCKATGEELADIRDADEASRRIQIMLRGAHESILAEGRADRKSYGMGATASVVKLVELSGSERRAVIGNSGDSRVYVLRTGGELEQVTTDEPYSDFLKKFGAKKIATTSKLLSRVKTAADIDKLGEDAWFLFENRHYLGQCLGTLGNFEPRISTIEVSAGDRIIITSDGVHDNLTDDEIANAVQGSSNAKDAASKLVQAAKVRSKKRHLRAKPDDTTAVVIEVK